ncbi:ketol-acid reductoisomerase [Neocallimastix californiae]|uniref:Acetohydroxy-acid reductoisomerase n=1 Tax=Neocallimastix californiae TaxID=1754190 RepID=A0A1Y1ZN82_9FUNG|nr:ketol-acid reductoisomerase [Neocallimastix californiae]|eukprot:ORY11467.1 ketol-acid reductoisomerase [Neocallimastix californiae]
MVKTINFGGVDETVYERSDFPQQKLNEIFKNDTFAVIGYGTQGRNQSRNLRDKGFKVVIGLRKGPSWDLAKEDGWIEGETLFEITEACKKGTIIMYLLSDAGQKAAWNSIKDLIHGKTLYFSHGFSIVFKDKTGKGRGINSSVAIFQDWSGKAEERAYATGIAIGSGYLYPTTFERETYSDLTGERGTLMGCIQGIFKAQFEVLISNGHTPSEAFNETVEEATQSLYPLIGKNGMDWMYNNCSTTARRGALDWMDKFYSATKPVFEELYESVRNGTEAENTLIANSKPDYRENLSKELKELRESQLWQTAVTVRSLRPENQKVENN